MAGNANSGSRKAKIWRDALNLEANREVDGEKQIVLAAKQLMIKVLSGDVQALKEFGDRIDGKVPQGVIGGEEDDPALKVIYSWLTKQEPNAS